MQHDFDLANQSGAAFRADANNALEALVTLSAGSTAPSVTFANQLWYDQSTTTLKKRNDGNTGWISVAEFDETGLSVTLLGSNDISGLTSEAEPDAADTIAFYDVSIAAMRKATLANVFKAIAGLTALTAPVVADQLVIYDVSAGAAKVITLQNLFAVVGGFTELTSADAANDILPIFDASDGSIKGIKPQNLSGASGVTEIATGSLSGASVQITSIPAGYSYLCLRLLGVSRSGAGTQSLRVHPSTDNGGTYDTTAANFPSDAGDLEGFVDMTAIGASETKDVGVVIFGYQNGPMKAFQSYATGNNPTAGFYIGSNAAINALRLSWSSGSSFDAGTYKLYGVN